MVLQCRQSEVGIAIVAAMCVAQRKCRTDKTVLEAATRRNMFSGRRSTVVGKVKIRKGRGKNTPWTPTEKGQSCEKKANYELNQQGTNRSKAKTA